MFRAGAWTVLGKKRALKKETKLSVLFLCTHNSARSQMAEGLLRALRGDRYEVHSAGTEPDGVNPYAVRVMAEIGMDIGNHRSKHVDEFRETAFDYVVTVCDNAKEACPFFPGAKKTIHKSFEDPSAFAGGTEDILAGFRRVRDQIRDWIEKKF
jgi:arsenate reductase